jgi:hypothetical protein
MPENRLFWGGFWAFFGYKWGNMGREKIVILVCFQNLIATKAKKREILHRGEGGTLFFGQAG